MMRTPEEERIFHALSQMKTPEYDLSGIIEQAGSHRRARLRPGRPLAVAAVLCTLLTIGAAAVGISGAWRYFAPSLPQNAVETVGVSQTAGDYTLTVEEAVVDDDNIMLLLALRRADGGAIDPEASLTTNSMNLRLEVNGNSFGRSTDYQLSPDGKTIYICYENTGTPIEESILGSPITLTAEGVAVKLWNLGDHYTRIRCDTPVSLAPLAEVEIPDFSGVRLNDHAEAIARAAAAVGVTLQLPMAEDFPTLTIRGAAMTDEGLALVVVREPCTSGDLLCTQVACDGLVDTRTSGWYPDVSSRGVELEDGTWAMLTVFRDGTLTPEDLPYLEAKVSYAIDRVLSDAPFSLTFVVNESSGLSVPLPETLELNGVALHPTDLHLSALKLTFSFEDYREEVEQAIYTDKLTPVLHLADGSTVAMGRSYSRSEDRYTTVSFRAEDADGERLFIDPGQVVSITFGNLEIPVEH